MNKYFWINILLVLVILLILAYTIPIKITGLAINQIYLSIKSYVKGEITAFVYDTFIDLEEAEKQVIFVEFTNTGSENYTAQIEENLYLYDDGQLNEVAYYYDSSVFLFPGMKRAFNTTYTPMQNGTYYIKVKASYGSRRTEVWGSFYAGYIIPNYTPGPPGPGPPAGPGKGWELPPPILVYVEAQPDDLSLEYPEELELYPGQNILTSINLRNIGNDTLHEIKLYLSTTNMIDIDISPKQIYYLERNEASLFLLDIDTEPEIPIGTYLIDFQIVTREIKKEGTISLKIVPYNLTLEDEVRRIILNYEYLITELEIDLLEAYLKGVDTTQAEESLDLAKINLEAARSYFNLGDYGKAMEILDEVKENLKDCVFLLAQASFMLFVPPAFSPIWILIIAVFIGFLFLFLQKRRKKKKPKLLRAVEESET
jgi:hypothetical protein